MSLILDIRRNTPLDELFQKLFVLLTYKYNILFELYLFIQKGITCFIKE